MATNENLPPNVIKQLAKELKNLDEIPPEGIKVGVNDDDFSTIYADIEGPGLSTDSHQFQIPGFWRHRHYRKNDFLHPAAATPYENGVFRLKLILTRDFPQSPPKGYFLTKIFHPNIANNGEICVNTLKKDWNPILGLRHVLLVVRCLLIEPFPESALNEQAGKMLLENYEEYARVARLYTGIHGKLKTKSTFRAISKSTAALNVDQTNASGWNIDPTNPLSRGGVLPAPSPLASSVSAGKRMSSGDESTVLGAVSESGGGGSAAVAALPQKKKAVSTAKAVADKRKIDARKKSLKRL